VKKQKTIMKNMSKLFTAILLSSMLFVASSNIYAQGPTAPPDDPSLPDGGTPNGPVGGGAPIGTGACLLLSLSVAYGTLLFFQLKRKKTEDLPDQSSD
jgi:hypothetical protein